MIGSQLAHYRVLAKLGEGGMGAVYRAEDTRLGRAVALKLLPEAHAADRDAQTRFLAEARAVAALDHPNICMRYEFGEHEGRAFIAMQLVDGETLKQAIARGPLGEDEVRRIATGVAAALAAAHARGIVHRDVKSENVLLGRDGSVKLADFGIARLADEARLTRSGMVGTPASMAPEQVLGGEVTPATDQWGLGVTLHECLTGTLPFASQTVGGLVHAVLNEIPSAPSTRRPGLSPAWDAILARALARQPAERFESMEALARAVEETAPRTESRPPGEKRPPSVAVLYFDNLSSDAESDYFCAGITEDLLTDLSKVEGLHVASRNAVARYRGQAVDIPRVADDLGVGAVLEGSVRKVGNRVRINAQLIDASNGYHLWADRYDRTLEDVFAVQDDITSSIATALRSALTAGETRDMHLARPGDTRAYDLYLKGRAHYHRYTHEDMQQALARFEEAIEVDPRYALAWAGIADVCGQMADKGYDLDPAWLRRGEQAGRHAVEIEPRLPEAHKALALCLHMTGRIDEAVRHLHAAVKLNPRLAGALGNLGVLRLDAGDFAGTERCIRRAVEVDPAHAYALMTLSFLCLETSRFEEAITVSHAAQRWGTGPFLQSAVHCVRLLARVQLGHWEAARGEIDGVRAAGLSEGTLETARMLIEASEGRPVEPPPVELDRTSQTVSLYLHAALCAAAGDPDRLVKTLSLAAQIDPHSWTSFPVFVRVASRYRAVRRTTALQAWLGDRGRTLVWPSEAPPLSDEDRAQFAEFRVESGLPTGDGIV